jgi:GNAT superfamily N-acetyltransferase
MIFHPPDGGYVIAAARRRHLPHLAAIELAAAKLLEEHAPPAVLEETTDLDTLESARRAGRLWVASCDDVPVGFAHAIVNGDDVHLEEIDVHPDHARRGIGTRLVRTICEWAALRRYTAVTLTTFRDVPFNMPFYARLGFVPVPHEALSDWLREVVGDEARRGLDPTRRVVMRWSVG